MLLWKNLTQFTVYKLNSQEINSYFIHDFVLNDGVDSFEMHFLAGGSKFNGTSIFEISFDIKRKCKVTLETGMAYSKSTPT